MTNANDPLAIVLLDHGSRRAEANALLDELALHVARRRPEAIVRAAHLEIAKPDLLDAVAECVRAGARRIVVHPFFLSPGRHTIQDVPAQIQAAREQHPEIAIAQSESLGLSDPLVEIVLQRIDEAVG